MAANVADTFSDYIFKHKGLPDSIVSKHNCKLQPTSWSGYCKELVWTWRFLHRDNCRQMKSLKFLTWWMKNTYVDIFHTIKMFKPSCYLPRSIFTSHSSQIVSWNRHWVGFWVGSNDSVVVCKWQLRSIYVLRRCQCKRKIIFGGCSVFIQSYRSLSSFRSVAESQAIQM